MRAACIFLFLAVLTCSARANSYDYEPLQPPKAGDIVAFTNGLPPSTGTQKIVRREKIMAFLRRGKNNLDHRSWHELEYPADTDGYIVYRDGVMLDRKGQFIFWFLRSPKVLKLQTPDGKTALLQLP